MWVQKQLEWGLSLILSLPEDPVPITGLPCQVLVREGMPCPAVTCARVSWYTEGLPCLIREGKGEIGEGAV